MSSKPRLLPSLLGLLASLLVGACEPSAPPAATAAPPPAAAPAEPSPLVAEIREQGTLDCFPEGMKGPDGVLATCEISAAVQAGGQVVFLNDKGVPGGSPVSFLPAAKTFAEAGMLEPVRSPVFDELQKLEAATVTPDGAWVLASTGFDRAKDDSAEWNPYNTLVYWPAGRPEEARVALSSTVEGFTSSIALRETIREALVSDLYPDGPPYFKVEGLAALPDGRLLFGVREIGDRYDDFSYSVRLLAVPFEIRDGELLLTGPMTSIYDVVPFAARMRSPLGISSVEYDAARDRLLILTSFEEGTLPGAIGAYLWSLPLETLAVGGPPSPLRTAEGELVTFDHKAEGMTFLDPDHLLVVCDDDRVVDTGDGPEGARPFGRQLHQFAYSVVGLR